MEFRKTEWAVSKLPRSGCDFPRSCLGHLQIVKAMSLILGLSWPRVCFVENVTILFKKDRRHCSGF